MQPEDSRRVRAVRVTTEYVEREDRLRLACETDRGDVVVLWLTQRLVLRLLPHLLAWLEPAEDSKAARPASPGLRVRQDLEAGFAQEAARAALPAQPAVAARSPSRAWLVQTVDVGRGASEVRLTFRDDDGEGVTFAMGSTALRQWLGIVHDAFRAAGWPMQAWPAWTAGGAAGAGAVTQLH